MAKRRKRNKKWISWLIILVLLIGAGVVCYMVWDSYFRDKSEPETSETSDDIEGEEQENNTEIELTSEEPEKKKVEQYDGEDPNLADDLSGVVTYAGVNNGVLMIRVNIDQYLDSGKCELTLNRGGATIHSSIASIIGSASTSTCEGFDVAVGELGGGNVEINIKLESNGRVGSIHGEANI